MFEERGVAGTREEGADGARTSKTDVADARARRAWRIPLSFLIARYFFYVLAALAGVWLGVQHDAQRRARLFSELRRGPC